MRNLLVIGTLAMSACSEDAARIPPDTQPLGTLGQIRASLRTVCGPTVRPQPVGYPMRVARQFRYDIACVRRSADEDVEAAWSVIVSLEGFRPTAIDAFGGSDPVDLDDAADDDWKVVRAA